MNAVTSTDYKFDNIKKSIVIIICINRPCHQTEIVNGAHLGPG